MQKMGINTSKKENNDFNDIDNIDININKGLNYINKGKYELGLNILEEQQIDLLINLIKNINININININNDEFNYYKDKTDYLQGIIQDVINTKIKTKNILVEFTNIDGFQNIDWKTNKIESTNIEHYITQYCSIS